MGEGVRTTIMRGGTSRGLFFEAADLPADPAAREDLLLRLMGTPDPRQIDGLGGATSLTSKVAVVSSSPRDDVDVDYLFLQLGVAEATVSDAQNCGNILAGVGPFAIERGLVPAVDGETVVRIRMVNSDSVAVATVPTPGGEVELRGDVAIAGVPGTAAGITLAFTDTEGSTTGSLLPTGQVRDVVDGVEVTCVDNGMPVVLAQASSFGLTGHESHEDLAADTGLAERIDAFRTKAGALMGLGDVARSSVPKTVLLAPPADGGQVATRSFIPVVPHTAIGVLAAVSVVTGMLLPGAVGHELTHDWPSDSSRVDVEHPTGHFLVDVVVDTSASPPRVVRSGVVRTARTLMDGVAYPRGALRAHEH
ncbi:4-oxalomesaconate tautomerase [Actinomycetospora endophytica]|uniref:4-oxalomesaconate tautomerase n=1 Tax=Actinomycetospora endophytica TaxID=2291215 RepID=A0ABS8PEH0_9PSEU|nr:4-oxalomesaconate tautomerase [Actinomycetospora endophytica]MCD2196664.1 4-oxalomesaconate tautomerase [Actinomycetospora endophytica]